jgi:CRISPR system Cascade subunit CasD
LISACLGIERSDREQLDALGQSVSLTVRVDHGAVRPERGSLDGSKQQAKAGVRLADFHTVLDARKVDGRANKFPVVTRREYLYDAAFTVAVAERNGATIPLDRIAAALRRPRYTPVLGRRSCPISRPLLDQGAPVEAGDALRALACFPPVGGTVYAEDDLISDRPLVLRDVPIRGKHRQFGTRRVYVHKEDQP